MELQTGLDDSGRRLDRILRKALPEHPLSLIHRLLRQGRILVDGKPAAAQDRLPAGAVITITAKLEGPGHKTSAEPPSRLLSTIELFGNQPGSRASPMPAVIWQGAGLLILNKPSGMAVHGHGGMDTLVRSCLANSLLPSLSFRPGPLHRLDKPSSGLIVFSTGMEGARRFSALMRERRIKKYYLALVEGFVEKPGVWQDELVRDKNIQKTFISGGASGTETAKTALTRFSPLAAVPAYSLILADIATGRTHQIRAQAAAHGHPLAGDVKYGGHAFTGGLLLHAWKLEFDESFLPAPPGGSRETPLPRLVSAPPPDAFQRRIRSIFGADIVNALLHKIP